MKPRSLTATNQQAFKSQAWLAKQMKSFYVAVGLLSFIILFGIAGYMIVEDWGLHDAFYMTIITLSTVGYGEVIPLTKNGQLFSSILIIMGMFVAAYSFGMIGRTALEGELNRFRGISRMFKKIAALEDHIILCGYGRLAKFIIPDLLDSGCEVVVIDSNPLAIIDLEGLGIPYVEGNAYEDDTLKQAGIGRARALLALLPNDSDNVFITLTARALNEKLSIISRTELLSGESKLRQAGANTVISPYRVSASRLVQQLLHPVVNDFLEILSDDDGHHLAVEQVMVPGSSPVNGKTLGECRIREETGVIVAACQDDNGQMNLQPTKETVIHGGSMVVALGTREALAKFSSLVIGA